MGRPREFDEDLVVAKAREAFWSRGVAATSISDLSEATGLSVGSIYKAFSSKDDLCRLTLDDYLTEAIRSIAELFASCSSPMDGLDQWMEEGVRRAASKSSTRGCYAVACATELAETDPIVRERLVAHDKQLRALIAGALRSASVTGGVSIDPEVGARLLCTTMNGLQVEARKGITLKDARATFAAIRRAL